MEYNYSEIGCRIREERRACKWSQEELIARLQDRGTGIGRNKVSSIENGEVEAVKSLSLSALEALCDLFECDLGYLLGEYDERRRVAAEVCAATGLNETATQRLLDLKTDIAGCKAEKLFGAVPRTEILSRIISDSEFWRIINNLYVWTTPEISDFMSLYNSANTFSPASAAGISEWDPLGDAAQDGNIASAAMHFSNVARRAIGWEGEALENKNTASAEEPKR